MPLCWKKTARRGLDDMVVDIRKSVSELNSSGIRVVLLGRMIQLRFRLAPLLVRAHLRNVEARSDDFVLPEILNSMR